MQPNFLRVFVAVKDQESKKRALRRLNEIYL